MKLTIDRAKWLRGEIFESFLLRPTDGKMCCLGFLALQCGYTPEEITLKVTPYSTVSFTGVNKFPDTIVKASCDTPYPTQPLTQELINANDELEVDDNEREAKLTELFKQAGIDVEFIN